MQALDSDSQRRDPSGWPVFSSSSAELDSRSSPSGSDGSGQSSAASADEIPAEADEIPTTASASASGFGRRQSAGSGSNGSGGAANSGSSGRAGAGSAGASLVHDAEFARRVASLRALMGRLPDFFAPGAPQLRREQYSTLAQAAVRAENAQLVLAALAHQYANPRLFFSRRTQVEMANFLSFKGYLVEALRLLAWMSAHSIRPRHMYPYLCFLRCCLRREVPLAPLPLPEADTSVSAAAAAAAAAASVSTASPAAADVAASASAAAAAEADAAALSEAARSAVCDRHWALEDVLALPPCALPYSLVNSGLAARSAAGPDGVPLPSLSELARLCFVEILTHHARTASPAAVAEAGSLVAAAFARAGRGPALARWLFTAGPVALPGRAPLELLAEPAAAATLERLPQLEARLLLRALRPLLPASLPAPAAGPVLALAEAANDLTLAVRVSAALASVDDIAAADCRDPAERADVLGAPLLPSVSDLRLPAAELAALRELASSASSASSASGDDDAVDVAVDDATLLSLAAGAVLQGPPLLPETARLALVAADEPWVERHGPPCMLVANAAAAAALPERAARALASPAAARVSLSWRDDYAPLLALPPAARAALSVTADLLPVSGALLRMLLSRRCLATAYELWLATLHAALCPGAPRPRVDADLPAEHAPRDALRASGAALALRLDLDADAYAKADADNGPDADDDADADADTNAEVHADAAEAQLVRMPPGVALRLRWGLAFERRPEAVMPWLLDYVKPNDKDHSKKSNKLNVDTSVPLPASALPTLLPLAGLQDRPSKPVSAAVAAAADAAEAAAAPSASASAAALAAAAADLLPTAVDKAATAEAEAAAEAAAAAAQLGPRPFVPAATELSSFFSQSLGALLTQAAAVDRPFAHYLLRTFGLGYATDTDQNTRKISQRYFAILMLHQNSCTLFRIIFTFIYDKKLSHISITLNFCFCLAHSVCRSRFSPRRAPGRGRCRCRWPRACCRCRSPRSRYFP